MIAPRPALWEVGQLDDLMVKNRIRGLGADERLQMDSFDGARRRNGVQAEPALASVLKP